jgi:hypothetical protein
MIRSIGMLVLMAIINLCFPIQAQTIHKDDLQCFAGAFAVKYPGQHLSLDEITGDEIDYSKFIDWRFIYPDSQGFIRGYDSIPYVPEKRWVFFPRDWQTIKQFNWNYYHPNLTKYKYYIMADYLGHEVQFNILSIWEPVGKDSLRYCGGQFGPFNTSIGGAQVAALTLFPDTSILMAVKLGGEGYVGYSFLRGVTPFKFTEFYKDNENSEGFEDDTSGITIDLLYRFDHLGLGSYKITEVKEYYSWRNQRFPSGYDHYKTNLDSSTIAIIDLWQKAKDYFNIDTTGITEDYWR